MPKHTFCSSFTQAHKQRHPWRCNKAILTSPEQLTDPPPPRLHSEENPHNGRRNAISSTESLISRLNTGSSPFVLSSSFSISPESHQQIALHTHQWTAPWFCLKKHRRRQRGRGPTRWQAGHRDQTVGGRRRGSSRVCLWERQQWNTTGKSTRQFQEGQLRLIHPARAAELKNQNSLSLPKRLFHGPRWGSPTSSPLSVPLKLSTGSHHVWMLVCCFL